MHDLLKFSIANFEARVADTISIAWEGKEFDPGPLNLELDSTSGICNDGVLDYTFGRAQAAFNVLLTFPEFASTLEAIGVDPELTRPVRAVIRSEGNILSDHSFVLSGPCDVLPHALLKAEETRASVLPGT
jgi:hypothetical protein